MRVGFDASILGASTRYSGIGQYSLKLLNELARVDDSNEYLLYAPADCARPADLDARLHWKSLPRPRAGKLSELGASVWTVPRVAEADRVDVFHSPTVHPRPSWPAVPVRMRRPLVVTLHDLIPLKFYSGGPDKMPFRWRLFYRWNLRAASRADLIITVSEAARREVLDGLSLDATRVRVIYNGVDAPSAVGSPAADTQPYIMYVGSFEPRKNLPRLVRAYGQAVREGLQHDLVVIADPASGDTKGVQRELAAVGLAGRVRFLHAVPEERLWELYQQAELFVFPSLAEGFGLPPLEAMAAGTPVIASDIPALREVLGDAACFVDPHSEESLATAILQLANNPARRAQLAKLGGTQARGYTWRDCAEKTLLAYEQVARSSRDVYTRRPSAAGVS
jgi:glycosyltransferase involved in cell wall biosynthesis